MESSRRRRVRGPLSRRQQKRSYNAVVIFLLVGLGLIVTTIVFTYRSISMQDSGISQPQLPVKEKNVGNLAVDDKKDNEVLAADASDSGGRIMRGDASVGKGTPDIAENSGGFDHWKEIAQNLASLTPDRALQELDSDPFGVRAFDGDLIRRETELGRVLTQSELEELFSCPAPTERITLPDVRDEVKAKAFRDNVPGTFMFFQHLRKAGGTNFCSLAEKNFPRSAQPPYYCMPDMGWSGNKNAGYLHTWSNQEIISRMRSSGHRIAGNEWENFDFSRHFELPAIFATSFRKPLDRALSQFRFECIEDRGCHIKDINTWWDQRGDLSNIYTRTFADPALGVKKLFRGSHAEERRSLMGKALAVVSKFNIVLSMEWLAYAAPQVESILGFHDLSALTTRVRPHIGQAKRDDGQEKNALGAASIAKASWVPKEYLDAAQYKKMSEDLALDEILTDAARRMFLERLVCFDGAP